MSDLEMTVDESFAADDKVVTRWHGHGTNDGPMMGMAPPNAIVAPPNAAKKQSYFAA